MKQTNDMTDYDRHRNTKKRRKRVVAAAITIVAAGTLIYGIKKLQERSYKTIMTPPISDTYTENITTAPLTPVVTKEPEITQEITNTPTALPVTITEAPKATPTIIEEKVEPYDYSQPVPESAEVDDSYFDDAIFIGNSRTQGFLLYSGLAGATGYASRGLMVNTIFKEGIVKEGDSKLTAFEAMKKHPDFKKVYIMLGVNELGWSYDFLFYDGYSKIIDEIRSQSPEAQIYIQSILPVTKYKSETDKVYNNQNINEFNTMLKDLAIEKQVYYVNVAEAVEDEEGFLPKEAASDGVHLNKNYCKKWLAYLKTHTITTK